MCSLSVKVLSNYLHLQAHCDKLKAFRIAQFFQNSKIQKITVKKIFFQNFDTGFLLIGVFRVYSRSFIAKLAKTKKSISSEINPIYILRVEVEKPDCASNVLDCISYDALDGYICNYIIDYINITSNDID